ncbi:MAG: secretin N-terminal domain-containing protein, partial [Planctomycetota bacterium]
MPDDQTNGLMPATRSARWHLTVIPAAIGLVLAAMPASAQDADEPPADADTQPEVLLDWGDEPARNAQPARRRGGRMVQQEPEPTVSIPSLSEPMELTTLIDFVGATLNLNIVVNGTPTGQIVFNAPVEVPQSKLLDLLDAMLEQYSFTVSYEEASGFYIVQPVAQVRPSLGGERASVRIIPTPNIKPSQIASALGAMLGTGSGGGAGAAASGGTATGPIQAVDELGVLIVNAPTRDIARVESMVAELMRIDGEQEFIRLELDHIAAPAALDRAIGLVGASSGGNQGGVAALLAQGNRRTEGGGNALSGLGGAGTFSNLADRMTVDPQGNALIFRGTTGEIERVKRVLSLIDVPNKLQPKSYFAGSAAAQIADIASRSGFGQVIQVENQLTGQGGNVNQLLRQGQNQLGTNFGTDGDSSIGGPVMVVDVSTGRIIYYGTVEQQRQLAELMDELRTEDERVVLRTYVLNHSDAVTVSDLINAVITGEQQTGDSPLLPTQTGNRNTLGTLANQQFLRGLAGGGDDVLGVFDPNIVSVTAAEE